MLSECEKGKWESSAGINYTFYEGFAQSFSVDVNFLSWKKSNHEVKPLNCQRASPTSKTNWLRGLPRVTEIV